MSMQLQMWKKDLDQGKAISLEVTSSLLEPTLSQGDAVSVRFVPFNQLQVGDIILCVLANKASLRKVSQSRHMYGVRSMSVLDADGTAQSVPEGMVLGKVVTMRRRGQAAVRPSLFSRLKSLLFQKS